MTTTESIPQAWDDERDGSFFRITAQLFSTDFCYGASVLLASYDVDDEVYGETVTAQPVVATAEATPATAITTAVHRSA